MKKIRINSLLLFPVALQFVIGCPDTSFPKSNKSTQKNYKKKNTISVPSDTIRIALKLNIQNSIIYSTGPLRIGIRSGNKFGRITGKGRIVLASVKNQNGKPSAYLEIQKKRDGSFFFHVHCMLCHHIILSN